MMMEMVKDFPCLATTKVEQETLYLIYKYLDSLSSCKDASALLKNSLHQNFLLGDVYSWDGSRKKADIKDMDRRYSHIPQNMLISLLQRSTSSASNDARSLSSIITTAAVSTCPSVQDLMSYHELLSQLTSCAIEQSNIRQEITETNARLRKLINLIESYVNYVEIPGVPSPPEFDQLIEYQKCLTSRERADLYVTAESPLSSSSSIQRINNDDLLLKQHQRDIDQTRSLIDICKKHQEVHDMQIAQKQAEYRELESKLNNPEATEESRQKMRSSLSLAEELIKRLTDSLKEKVSDLPALEARLKQYQTCYEKFLADRVVRDSEIVQSTSHEGTQLNVQPGYRKKSALYTVNLRGMHKEKMNLEIKLRELKEQHLSQHASTRSAIEARLASKPHVDTSLAKRFHGVCDNSIDRLHLKYTGNSRYGVRSDLMSLWAGNRTAPVESSHATPSAISSAKAEFAVQYKKLWTVSGHLWHPAYTAVIDRSGRFAITGSDDYLVKIWDIETGQLVRTCRGHKGPIVNVVISADNALMATACIKGTVRLWRLADGRCLRIWRHESPDPIPINCLEFDSLTCALIYGCDDGTCVVRDLTFLLFEDSEDSDGQSGSSSEVALPSTNVFSLLGVSTQRSRSRLCFTGQYPLLECAHEDMVERVRQQILDLQDPEKTHISPVTYESTSACAFSNLLVNKSSDTVGTDAPKSYFSKSVENEDLMQEEIEISAVVYNESDLPQTLTAEHEESMQDEVTISTSVSKIKKSLGLTFEQEEILRSSSELFSWNDPRDRETYSVSKNSSSSCTSSSSSLSLSRSLFLPHFTPDLRGDAISVDSLDICSVSSLLVTGCSDGVARVWRITEPLVTLNRQFSKLDSSKDWSKTLGEDGIHTAKRRQQERKNLDILLSLSPSVLNNPDLLENFETVAYRQLCRLEGHVSAVTDVQFSHAGDRILTGSWKKDGTVRIWTFSKDFLKHDHMILSIDENDFVGEPDDDRSVVQNKTRGPGRVSSNRSTNKPQIHNVYWSCDDKYILVVHSFVPIQRQQEYSEYCAPKEEGTRLRVYNSSTGKLLKIITISLQKCHVLACHPINPNLAFTAGKEGILSVWNVLTGERVVQHRNICPKGGITLDATTSFKEDGPLEIVDGKFSLDGLRIAATDVVGRIIILGNDNPDRFHEKVHGEQYFLTDYSNVIHDNEGWPIDEDSQLPLHQAPVGPLCRTDCTPYPVQPTSFPLPQPFSKQVTQANLKELLYWRDKYPFTVNRAYVAHKKYMVRTGDSSSTSFVQPIVASKSSSVSRTNPNNRREDPSPRQHSQSMDNYSRRYKRSRRYVEYCEDSEEELEAINRIEEEYENNAEEEDDEEFTTRARSDRSRRSLKRSSRLKTSQSDEDEQRTETRKRGRKPKRRDANNIDQRSQDESNNFESSVNYVANCSSCGQIGRFMRYSPPSGIIYFKPHFIKTEVTEDGAKPIKKCGEFSKDPRPANIMTHEENKNLKRHTSNRKSHVFTYPHYASHEIPGIIEKMKRYAYRGEIQTVVRKDGTPCLQGKIWCEKPRGENSFGLPTSCIWDSIYQRGGYGKERDYIGKEDAPDGLFTSSWGPCESSVESNKDISISVSQDQLVIDNIIPTSSSNIDGVLEVVPSTSESSVKLDTSIQDFISAASIDTDVEQDSFEMIVGAIYEQRNIFDKIVENLSDEDDEMLEKCDEDDDQSVEDSDSDSDDMLDLSTGGSGNNVTNMEISCDTTASKSDSLLQNDSEEEVSEDDSDEGHSSEDDSDRDSQIDSINSSEDEFGNDSDHNSDEFNSDSDASRHEENNDAVGKNDNDDEEDDDNDVEEEEADVLQKRTTTRARMLKNSRRTIKSKSNLIIAWAKHNGYRTVPIEADIDVEWLEAAKTHEYQYVPQIGDKVIYFPQGHTEHLQSMPETSRPPWFSYHTQLRSLLNTNGLSNSGKWPCVECRVTDYRFDFPTFSEYKKCRSALVEIELEVTGVPQLAKSSGQSAHIQSKFVPLSFTNDEEKITFKVTLRDLNLPDFLIPSYLYQQSCLVPWKKGTKFQTYFKEIEGSKIEWKKYSGVVVRCSDFDEEWPDSPWNSLEIVWGESLGRVEEFNSDRISPWDAKILDDHKFESLCAKHPSCLPSKLSAKTVSFVLSKIVEFMNSIDFEPFNFPIASESFPEYYCLIPSSMYLDLIRSRLENNYYRQLEALQYDIELLERNCVLFNREGTDIITTSTRLVELLLDVINQAKTYENDDYTIAISSNKSKSIDQRYESSSTNNSSRVNDNINGSNTSSSSTEVGTLSIEATPNDRSMSSSDLRLRFRSTAALHRSPQGIESISSWDTNLGVPAIINSSNESNKGINNEVSSSSSRVKRKRESISDESTKVKGSKAKNESPAKRTSSRSRRGNTRYAEVDSDADVDEKSFLSGSESEEEATQNSSRIVVPRKVSRRNPKINSDEENSELGNVRSKRAGSSSRQNLSKEVVAAMNEIVDFCEDLDQDFGYFLYPVTDEIAPGYSEIILNPMDYTLIRNKLKASKYRSIQQLASDIMQIFENCELYNDPESDVVKVSKKQRREVKKFLQNYGV